jgi:recombination protein RecA
MTPPRQKKSLTPSVEDAAAVDEYLGSLQKRFGVGSGFTLEGECTREVEVIPSKVPGIDRALRCGGIPKGRITEIFGPESSGKTTLALQFVAAAQQVDTERVAHFIDAEHALDPAYAKAIGIDPSRFLISQPDNGEQALDMVEHAASSNAVSIVVIDSVAALVPKAELEGDMGDPQMGVQARLMSQAMRKLTSVLSKSNSAAIFINQIRMKIGVMFGNPETTAGGQALKFYSSVRIDTRKRQVIKKGDEAIGQATQIKVVKNKMAPPLGVCEVDLIYGWGFDAVKSLLEIAIEKGVVEQNGAWFSLNGERLGQGKDNAANILREDPALYNMVSEKIAT